MKLSGPRSLNLPFYLLKILNMDPAVSWIPLQYLRRDPSTAGYLTHREAGYCVEIATEAALQASKKGGREVIDLNTRMMFEIATRLSRLGDNSGTDGAVGDPDVRARRWALRAIVRRWLS